MNQLKAIQVFVRCVERGSLSAVANEFNTTQPSISKLISSLESHLGGALLLRSTQGVRLTPQGQNYFDACKSIVNAVANADEAFGQTRNAISGRVCISTSYAFGKRKIIPHLDLLMQSHPMLEIDLKLGDRFVDLIAEGVDIAFRFGYLKDSGLISQRVGTSRRLLVAAPGYLQRHAEPITLDDLSAHECLGFDTATTGKTLSFASPQVKLKVQGRFQTNSPESSHDAALAGLGIAAISEWMVGKDLQTGRLVRVLENHKLAETPIHAITLQKTRHLARVRTVLDFFLASFNGDPEISK